jgi:hypothetical protein
MVFTYLKVAFGQLGLLDLHERLPIFAALEELVQLIISTTCNTT